MKQRALIYIVIIICGILALYLNQISRQNTITEEATISVLETGYFLTLSVTPSITPIPPSPTLNATKIFEHTAIARFTENPEWALSSTPYYGDILYNHAMDFFIVTPTLPPSQPTPECWLYAAYINMAEFSADIVETLAQSYDLAASAQTFNYPLYNISNCDDYLLVKNRISIGILSPELVDSAHAGEMTEQILSVLAGAIGDSEEFTDESYNIFLYIDFTQADKHFILNSNWQMASQAYEDGLEGEALLEALGGLQN
jgi:hypothetical protein